MNPPELIHSSAPHFVAVDEGSRDAKGRKSFVVDEDRQTAVNSDDMADAMDAANRKKVSFSADTSTQAGTKKSINPDVEVAKASVTESADQDRPASPHAPPKFQVAKPLSIETPAAEISALSAGYKTTAPRDPETDPDNAGEMAHAVDAATREKVSFSAYAPPPSGTKEFIKRNGEFTVNIALIHKQKSILGVIYVPVTKTLYFAAENVGCYKLIINNSQVTSLEELIKSSQELPLTTTNTKFTVVASRSHLSEETQMFIDGLRTAHKEVDFLSSGSSIKLCLVAEGSANVYPRFAPTMEWDTAAGQAICEIAGKKVLDYTTNQNLLYNKPNLLNNWFIVQ